MKALLPCIIPVVWCFLLTPGFPTVQNNSSTTFAVSPPATGLFDSEEVLEIKLSGKVRELFNDRSDKGSYHTLLLSYKDGDANVSIPLRAKTRGHFRKDKENCKLPPILLNFQKATTAKTLFQNQDKLKLVMPCTEEDYVIREYLVYKLYNLVTPKSFKARLVKVSFFDSSRKKEVANFYSFLLEEESEMAKRNGTKILNKLRMAGESTETETFLKMAVFQYMIGNTDWSVPFLHNIRILAIDSLSIPSVVPYDFDHSGIVDALYALPPEQLILKSTQDRRFRGYCISDMRTFDEVIATFNRLQKDFYNLYANFPLLDTKYKASTLKFLDGFYRTINDPKKVKAAFTYPCQKGQQIVVKGLEN